MLAYNAPGRAGILIFMALVDLIAVDFMDAKRPLRSKVPLASASPGLLCMGAPAVSWSARLMCTARGRRWATFCCSWARSAWASWPSGRRLPACARFTVRA